MRPMRTTHDDLEPIKPSAARELFRQHKSTECDKNTAQSYGYRTGHFVRWCDQQAVENTNELTGRTLQEYRL